MMRILTLLLSIAAALPALAEPAVPIREWDVPWERTRPRDPAVAPDGRVWFVGQQGDYLASLDPKSGSFTKVDLEKGAAPHNLIVAADGTVWYAGNRDAYIGRLDPKSGTVKRFPMPDPAARDPHTLAFDPAGDIWFTVQGGNFVGKLDVDSGAVRLVKLPLRGSRPYGIVVAPDGRPWFNEFGANRIGTVDPKSFELEEFELPEGARDRRIALAKDGGVWYVDYARGRVARLDPKSRRVSEWTTPGGDGSLPYAMAIDSAGRLWFVETGPQPNRLVGFDPAEKAFFSVTEIPSGGSTVRHMVFHEPTRSLWFGTDKNTIGRALLP
ncbi:MAG TPA: lyase [Thermoanaerobaculia bacterium]|nr:lyase [Thermoanaerobaculia bacterium]